MKKTARLRDEKDRAKLGGEKEDGPVRRLALPVHDQLPHLLRNGPSGSIQGYLVHKKLHQVDLLSVFTPVRWDRRLSACAPCATPSGCDAKRTGVR